MNNNGVWHKSISSKGILAWFLGVILTAFYVLIYWFPEILGLAQNGNENSGFIALFNPLSYFLKGQAASQWFAYGTIYTFFIVAFGVKFMFKYKENKYQLIRTSVVIFCQLILAYLLPEILEGFSNPNHYFA